MKLDELAKLERKLGYAFVDKGQLLLALTHRSSSSRNNERLEFLGDSIINFVIAEALYEQFPDAREGELSRLRARLVRGITLAELGREFDLGDFLRLGSGELKSGGYRRQSILADTVEAIIGALYLDAGMEVCQRHIRNWFKQRLNRLSTSDQQNKDPKTRLQEFLQANHKPLPEYRVESITGEAHEQIFTVICELATLDSVTVGKGSSRRGAEQQAARKALNLMDVES